MKKHLNLICFLTVVIAARIGHAQPLVANVSPPQQCYNVNGNSAMATIVSSPPGAVSYSWGVQSPGLSCNVITTPMSPNGSAISFNFPCCGVYTLACLALNISNFPVGNFVTTVTISCTSLTLSPAGLILCSGGTGTLSASGASSYTWLPGGSTASTLGISPAGNSCYTVTGLSSSGCTAQAVSCVTIQPALNLTVSPSSQTVCPGATATFTASGASSYTWLPGNANTATFAVVPGGNACYSVTGSSGTGCMGYATVCVSVKPVSVTVNPSAASICAGGTVVLTAGGASSYTWSPGNSTGSSVTFTPGSNSCYTVTGTAQGCTAQAVSCVTLETVSLSVTPSSQTVCVGASVSFTASGAGSYTWTGGSTNPIFTVVPLQSTTYKVLGANGSCMIAKSVNVNVSSNPAIGVSSSTAVLCKGQSATLTASGAQSYTWSGSTSTASALVISPSVTTIYTITGKNSADCYNTTIHIQTVTICAGLEDMAEETQQISAYPNPGKGLFLIAGNTAFTGSVLEVQNISGQQVFNTAVTGSPAQCDLSAQPAGIYYARIRYSDGRYTQVFKLVKLKD